MIKKIFIFVIISTSIAMAQTRLDSVKSLISAKFNFAQGNFALAFKEVGNDSNTILINDKEVFHAASTMKTPVMIEVFKQVNQGKFKLDDSILVKNEFSSIVDGSKYSMDISDDGGEDLYKFIGQKKTIKDLMTDMIIVSSNLATNILIELVGADNVMSTMRSIGAKDIKVLRGVEDQKAYDKGLNNTTTAYDLMLIFEKIAKGEIINKSSCQAMMDILLQQKFNDVIPALLPSEVKVAHKTGSITGIIHDSGIVILPNNKKYILVLLSKNLKDDAKGRQMLSEVSRIVYDYMID